MKMNKKFYNELREKIQPYFEKSGSHAFDHTERVHNLALTIAKTENVDIDIVKTAALMHDIARKKQGYNYEICHAKEGARMTKEILKIMDFPKEKIDAVCHAIEVHRYSKNLKAEIKEAEIIQDADRLDAIGAITIARIFDWGAKRNRIIHDPNTNPEEYGDNHMSNTSINHFYEKILKIKPETFKTKKAKEIAKKRYEFTKQFVEEFIKEWEGKK